MKFFLKFTLVVILAQLWLSWAIAQTPTQTIRGQVVDKDAQMPLIGATVVILNMDTPLGTTTDTDGYFKMEKVPVGRHTIQVAYLGYEEMIMSSILLTSGKELVLNLELVESPLAMEEVVVTAKLEKEQPLNELATVSARSFSVEETARYAASYYDPARMAQNYAGVAVGNGDDIRNEIIIRGNSPRGVLWRMEGIEIPNPNHFANVGNSGGAVSMLSSSILSNSDFYTGAFPAEFGNALSGAFDLNMRNGNNEKPEYAIMLGALGVEAAAEGPFSANSRASYLINYRYSTLGLLQVMGVGFDGDEQVKYQDLSFKVNLPTAKAGTFSLFGIGGKNGSVFEPKADQAEWMFDDDKWGWIEEQQVGTIGLSHRLLLSDRSYLRTVLSASYNQYKDVDYWLDETKDYEKHEDEITKVVDRTARISSTYNHKFDARNTVQAGAIFSLLNFDFTHDEDNGEILSRYFDNTGSSGFFQSFAHWKHRFNDKWLLNTGLHYSQMTLNGKSSIEPRAAVQWQFSKRQSLSAAVGLHSKMEHLATYLFEGTFPDGTVHPAGKQLGLSKAMHAVLGYDHRLGPNLRLKLEAYYQHLYNVPIEVDPTYKGSLINTADIWDVIGAEEISDDGSGRNYGLDLTLEKFFSNQYYFLLTGSLYQSKYTAIDDKEYDTRYNGNYQMVLLGGKEFKMGKQRKNILGINGKFVYSGGNRHTPILLEASREEGRTVRDWSRPYADRTGAYSRFDFGISYRINRAKITHTIMIDIQNITNRNNIYELYYSSSSQQIKEIYQTGLLPIFNYRMEF
ncbi:MAG: prevent-host-death protein [Saprospiraceae bacterium]|nr:MAG: prevent-host-death protein [Saprospiraceae bacterium]